MRRGAHAVASGFRVRGAVLAALLAVLPGASCTSSSEPSCTATLLVERPDGRLVESSRQSSDGESVEDCGGTFRHGEEEVQWSMRSLGGGKATFEISHSGGGTRSVEIESGTSSDVLFEQGRVGVNIQVSGLTE